MIRFLGESLAKYINDLTDMNLSETEMKTIIIYSDTDSIYLSMEPIVERFQDKIPQDKIVEFLDRFVKDKIQPQIKNALEDLKEYMNFYQNALGAKREAIAQSGIWVGKKRYALHVWDMEGVRYDHPKVKVTGIETQKSSTPEVVRNALLDALEILLGGTEQQLRDFVVGFEQKFKQFPLEAISFPRSVNNVEKYSGTDGNPIKGCPGHVKAAIAHNIALQKLNLLDVQPITSGDKILYCYMKPNPFHTPAMAYVERPPKEFNLQNYIDYDTQFEKAFMGPLTSLMDAVKWGLVDKSSLDDFF
jgi:DNA polymerase elongation subunit (family B)